MEEKRRHAVNFDNSIEKIEQIIGYSFRDRRLLRQAFTRTSWCNEQNKGRRVKFQSSEVLEFIGDSALSTAIITMLMAEESTRYEHGLATELSEGDFSNIKASLSNKQNLAISTKRLELEKYLIMGEGDERLDISNQPSVMEDLFESIIGAIYIDSGMKIEPVIASVGKMLDVSVYKSSAGTRTVLQSAKNALQEWCADKKHRLPAPTYVTVEESGPDHEKLFVRGCYIDGILYGKGEGKNRKIADAKAAEAALKRLSLEEKAIDADDTSIANLRGICASRHAAPPSYTDLGESESSTPTDREFVAACSALGNTVVGIGKSKKEAKTDAAKKLIALL